MSTAAKPADNSEDISSSVRQIIQMMHPTLEEKKLEELISKVCITTNAICNSSSNYEDLNAKKNVLQDYLKNSPENHSQLFNILSNFKERQATILNNHGATLETPSSTKIDQEIQEAVAQSVQEGLTVQQVSQQKSCRFKECNVTENLKRCGRCKKAMYCSEEHQKLDWPRHRKVECVQIKKS